MSNTKEVHSKPRLHVTLSTCYLEYGRHFARLHRHLSAYAPTSNTGSHDNHEKINSWVSFWFPYMGCLWGSAWRPFRPPELRYYTKEYTRAWGLFLDYSCGFWCVPPRYWSIKFLFTVYDNDMTFLSEKARPAKSYSHRQIDRKVPADTIKWIWNMFRQPLQCGRLVEITFYYCIFFQITFLQERERRIGYK